MTLLTLTYPQLSNRALVQRIQRFEVQFPHGEFFSLSTLTTRQNISLYRDLLISQSDALLLHYRKLVCKQTLFIVGDFYRTQIFLSPTSSKQLTPSSKTFRIFPQLLFPSHSIDATHIADAIFLQKQYFQEAFILTPFHQKSPYTNISNFLLT